MDQVLMSAFKSLATLGYDLSQFGSPEQLAEMVESVNLSEVSKLHSGPVLFAAIAIAVYADDLLDYVNPPDPYLAAGTAVEIEAEEAEWGRFVKKQRLIDKIAEVLELMITEIGLADRAAS